MHFLLGLGFYFGVVSLSGFLRNQDSALHSWFHCCDECQLRFLSHAGGDGRSRPHLPFPLLCRGAGGHCCSSCFFWVFGLKLLPGVGIDCCVCGLQTFLIMQPYLQKYFDIGSSWASHFGAHCSGQWKRKGSQEAGDTSLARSPVYQGTVRSSSSSQFFWEAWLLRHQSIDWEFFHFVGFFGT